MERAVREEPGNAGAQEALFVLVLQGGYFREALRLAERVIESDPLSAAAHLCHYQAFLALDRIPEASRSLKLAGELGLDEGLLESELGLIALMDQRDEDAILHLETGLARQGGATGWVRDLVTIGRDPEAGQAFLDQELPRLWASLPAGRQRRLQIRRACYPVFGFLDRLFELILAFDLKSSEWDEAEVLILVGLWYRPAVFVSHPRFLEVAEGWSLFELWEERGAPDFAQKVDGSWVCR
jgi:hypothetical protein